MVIDRSWMAVALIFGTALSSGCGEGPEVPGAVSRTSAPLEGLYLGMTPPGHDPLLFAPGVVSTFYQSHSAPAFSPDGRWLFWSAWLHPYPTEVVFFMEQGEDGSWSDPEVAPFSGRYSDGQPFFSHDGQRLYFSSKRPGPGDAEGAEVGRTWFVERGENGFGDPRLFQPGGRDLPTITMSRDGTIYFPAFGGPQRKEDLYEMVPEEAGYGQPRRLSDAINSVHPELAPVVSPDGSTLVFTAWQREGPVTLSAIDALNRSTPGATENVYWVSTSVLEELRPEGY